MVRSSRYQSFLALFNFIDFFFYFLLNILSKILDTGSFYHGIEFLLGKKKSKLISDDTYPETSSVKWGLLARNGVGLFQVLTTLKLLKTTKITSSQKTPFFKITKK